VLHSPEIICIIIFGFVRFGETCQVYLKSREPLRHKIELFSMNNQSISRTCLLHLRMQTFLVFLCVKLHSSMSLMPAAHLFNDCKTNQLLLTSLLSIIKNLWRLPGCVCEFILI